MEIPAFRWRGRTHRCIKPSLPASAIAAAGAVAQRGRTYQMSGATVFDVRGDDAKGWGISSAGDRADYN